MASFKTMHIGGTTLSAVPLDCVVVGTISNWAQVVDIATRKATLAKQDFVRYFPAQGIEGQADYIPAYIRKATDAEVTAKEATHVVAQADVTMSGRNVATDQRDYRYIPLVAAQSTATPTDSSISPKKVNLWPIFDWNDVVADQVPSAEAVDRQ